MLPCLSTLPGRPARNETKKHDVARFKVDLEAADLAGLQGFEEMFLSVKHSWLLRRFVDVKHVKQGCNQASRQRFTTSKISLKHYFFLSESVAFRRVSESDRIDLRRLWTSADSNRPPGVCLRWREDRSSTLPQRRMISLKHDEGLEGSLAGEARLEADFRWRFESPLVRL